MRTVGIREEMVRLGVLHVEMSVRVSSMSYGSVLLTRIVGKGLWLNSGPYILGEALKALGNIEKASFV